MRALAALSVVGYHLALTGGAGGPLAPYLLHLNWGVVVFFVISGYVLYRPFLETAISGRRLLMRGYAARRILRIVPAFWVILIVAFLDGNEEIRADPFAYFGFAQIYSPDTLFGVIGQAWTLDVEMSFYFVLPLIAWALVAFSGRPTPSQLRVAAFLIAAVVASYLWAANPPPPPAGSEYPTPLFWLPRFIGFFALGMALASAAVRLERAPAAPLRLAWLRERSCLLLLLVPIGFVASTKLSGPEALVSLIDGLTAALLVAVAVLGPGQGPVGRVLSWRPLVYVGVVSYGIYLWHYTVLVKLAGVLPPDNPSVAVVWVLASVAAAIGLGAASWRFIERPAIEFSRKVPARGRSRSHDHLPDGSAG